MSEEVQNAEVSDTETSPVGHNEDAMKYGSRSHENFYN